MTRGRLRGCRLGAWRPSSFPVWITAAALLCGCDLPMARDTQYSGTSGNGGRSAMLAVNGFNYTDLSIDAFSVEGAGGGNIFVSSPTSGGGGTSCCVLMFAPDRLPQPITVRWMRYLNHRDRWCEKTVMLKGPVPEHPTALGVHFMPDGDIQLEVTSGYPHLKLRLKNFDDGHRYASGNVIHDEEVARCKDEP